MVAGRRRRRRIAKSLGMLLVAILSAINFRGGWKSVHSFLTYKMLIDAFPPGSAGPPEANKSNNNSPTSSSSSIQRSGPVAGAAAMLVGNDWMSNRGRHCYFNASMDALQKYWKPTHLDYPLILQKEMWTPDEMEIISKQWVDLNPRFELVGSAFLAEPPDSYDGNKTLPDLGPIPYKQMCRFKTFGFLDAPYLEPFDYVMFLDDDSCLLDDVGYDVFAKMRDTGAVYGYKEIMHDIGEVTVGLREFASNYMQERQWGYANPELKAEVDQHEQAYGSILAFSTNLEWIDLRAYRRPELLDFFQALDASGMIFHRRWGDAPLRFLLATMFWTSTEVMRVCVAYQHSIWEISGRDGCDDSIVSNSVLNGVRDFGLFRWHVCLFNRFFC